MNTVTFLRFILWVSKRTETRKKRNIYLNYVEPSRSGRMVKSVVL